MGSPVTLPPLPQGFTLDGPASAPAPTQGASNGLPPLPPGFTLDGAQSAPAPDSGASLDPDYYPRLGQIEANGNPLAVNKSTGASGLYQWMPATAKQYGVDPFDKSQSEAGIRKFTADNINQLSSSLGRAPTSAEVYLAHQQGAGGAAKLLSNPDAKAADIVGRDAVVLNGGSADMSAADFAKMVENKYVNANPKSMGGSLAGFLNRNLPDTGGQPQRGYDALAHRQTNTGDLPGAAKSLLVGLAHGAIDVPLNSATSGATWIGKQFGYGGANEKINAYNDRYNQDYAASPAGNSTAGTIGNIAGGIGTAMLTPELGLAKGLGYGAAALKGALGGGIYGAEQNSASPNGLLSDIMVNGGIGALGGPVAKFLAGRVGNLYGRLAGRGANAIGELPAAAHGELSAPLAGDVLPPAGGAPQGGPRSAPAGIYPTVGGAPRAGVIPPRPAPPAPANPFHPEPSIEPPSNPVRAATERLANFKALGLEGERGPTRAMITQNPTQQTVEADLQAQAHNKLGQEITQRYQGINAGLKEAADQVQAGTGASPAASTYETGQGAISAVQAKSDEMQAEVGKLYRGVRETVGENFGMKPQSLLGTMDEHSDIAEADPIITSVQRRLARLGIADPNGAWEAAKNAKPRVALSISESENLRKFINNLPANNPTTKMVRSGLVDALDKDVIDGSGIDAFKKARDAAHARFSEFDRATMKAMQAHTMAPEDVLKRTVWAGKIADLDSLKSSLLTGTPEQVQRGKAEWDKIRGQTMNKIIAAGFGEDGGGKFSPRGFNNMLDKTLGAERLKRIFTHDELATINRIRMAGKDAFGEIPFSTSNKSHSGTFLADHAGNALGRIAKTLEAGDKGAPALIAEGLGAGMLVRMGGYAAKGLDKIGEKATARAILEPNVEAAIASHARQVASAPVQKLLAKLPISRAASAAYEQKQQNQ